MRKNEDYIAILLEDIQSQIQRLAEAFSTFSEVPPKVNKLSEDMVEVKSDVKVIKAVMTDHSKLLSNHEHRITALETV